MTHATPFVSVFAVLLLAPVRAQVDPDLAERIKREGLQNSKVMEHLDYLTNHIGHRLTGSENLIKAAYWAASEFEKMGLTAEVEKWGEWKVAWNRGQWMGRVLSPTPMDLQIATNAWTAGTKGAVRGPLLALPKSLAEIEAKPPETFKGAWLFDVDSIPDYEAGAAEGRGRRRGGGGDDSRAAVREKLAALGIAGYLASSVGTKQYPNRIRVFGDSSVARRDWDRLPTIPEAVVRYDQAVQLAKLLKDGAPVQMEIELRNRFTPGPVPLFNVVAEIKGSELPEEYVYVSSHLDSWHQATGTTDNGTGSATTMEAARILAAVGAKPKRTIRFGLWGGEEQGLLGSREHATKLRRADMERVSAVFNHDTGTNWAARMGVTAAMKADMEKVFAPVMTMTAPDKDHKGPVFELREVRGLSGGGSDHASFLAAGVPGLNWDLLGRSDYFGYTWHSQYDTFDAAIPEYQAHTATVIALAALGTANLPNKLSREGLRDPNAQRGDATTMLEGYLGVTFEGLKVKSVATDGVLAKAGIAVGDVLKTANGKPVERLVDVFTIGREDNAAGNIELGFDRGGTMVKANMSATGLPRGRGRRGDNAEAPRGGAIDPVPPPPPPAVEPVKKKEPAVIR